MLRNSSAGLVHMYSYFSHKQSSYEPPTTNLMAELENLNLLEGKEELNNH